ncbi:tetratricopeptide repeat protein [Roseivirga sp.]|uniref:tetratricopeptide repeat protein n=1 Tax=Roseivirga sp. TaxID=1964215 RepID=UPI003B8C55AA
MKKLLVCGLILSGILFSSCEKHKEPIYIPESFQAVSLLGDSLNIPLRNVRTDSILKANIAQAQNDFDLDNSEMNTIWLGRRHAYLSDYKKAINIFSDGIKRFPNSYKLYRHRGHRYISIRQFNKAIADYQKAYELMPKGVEETEPDGAPNQMNIPLSNTQFNILYHYGLAYYLSGDFEKAEEIYKECMDYSGNPDLRVATTDWLYMTLRRLGKTEQAKRLLESIDPEMEIIENDSYLKRLSMYQGALAAEELLQGSGDDVALSLATQGYGLGNWYLYEGDTAKAKEIFQRVLQGSSWSAFGYIATEADFKRLN